MDHEIDQMFMEGVRLGTGNGKVRGGNSRRKLVLLSLDPEMTETVPEGMRLSSLLVVHKLPNGPVEHWSIGHSRRIPKMTGRYCNDAITQ